ncbi:MAG: lytic murein transglycosylase [Campylobacterota bacterium]|nr:lytic murein transglycosylase [Campylobacterota bacterium]
MKIFLLFLTSLLFLLTASHAKDYTKNRDTQLFIDALINESNIKRAYLEGLFSSVKRSDKALRKFLPRKNIERTPEQIAALKKMYPKYGAWDRYSRLKISNKRAEQGVRFIKKNQKIFDKVEKEFFVPKEYIAAIIGIETVYGRNVGKYPVFDTLTTLSFEKNRRNKFFKKQLKKFIYLSQKEKFNPKNVYGSYAGAIGLGQFMPSNYEAYGVDFNEDGRITLQHPADAIASIANYLRKNRWQKGEPVATRVRYAGTRFKSYKTGYRTAYDQDKLEGISLREAWNYRGKVRLIKLNKKSYDELWYGSKNFFVLTRYNHSAYYAMSVHILAQKIKKLNEKSSKGTL